MIQIKEKKQEPENNSSEETDVFSPIEMRISTYEDHSKDTTTNKNEDE